MSPSKRLNLILWILSVIGGLATGIAGFDDHSNHPTYLPPALHWLDNSYLAMDWWINSSLHYHIAFFALVALLAKIHILEPGLMVLNIVIVATGLRGCFRIIEWVERELIVPNSVLLLSLLLATRSFTSAGDSYIYSSSLQPSTIAASATIWAIVHFFRRRYWQAGITMAVGGLFHTNFLIVNLVFFGLVWFATNYNPRRPLWCINRDGAKEILLLIGPSLLILALFLPFILTLVSETVSATEAREAERIFFDFAVPYHYIPARNISSFLTLGAWQFLGLVWTYISFSDGPIRRSLFVMQAVLVVILWTATCLTSLIFIPEVSRLFFWRLAPFAVLLAAIAIVVGVSRLIRSGPEPGTSQRGFGVALIASAIALAILSTPVGALRSQMIDTRPFAPVFYLLFTICACASLAAKFHLLAQFLSKSLPPLSIFALFFSVMTQAGESTRSRYSALYVSAQEREDSELFAFIEASTSKSAIFVIPPELSFFRLEAGRSIIVDLKAFPMDKVSQIEWYRRLEDISGTHRPSRRYQVIRGYNLIDAGRLNALRDKYGIDYAVLRADNNTQSSDWEEKFRNKRYRVLAHVEDLL